MTYLLRRGPGSLRRKAHLAKYDQFGGIIGAWCERPYNLTSNVPWGCKTCKVCLRRRNAALMASRVGGESWPCDNYRAPLTCLTAPSSESGRCSKCASRGSSTSEGGGA